MQFKEVEIAYTRAWQKAFERKRVFVMFLILALCGLFMVAGHATVSISPIWLKGLFYFLPTFLIIGVLLAAGIFFARTYYYEVKEGKASYRGIFAKSLQLMVSLSQVSLPFILLYLVLWACMGLFFLIGEIPYLGPSMTLILSFIPFILALATLFLVFTAFFALFFVTPHIAFNKMPLESFFKQLLADVLSHLFSYGILFIVALLPLFLGGGLVFISFQMIALEVKSPLESTLQWFFLMIPISAVLSPIFLFFFNFSVESYNLVRKLDRQADRI